MAKFLEFSLVIFLIFLCQQGDVAGRPTKCTLSNILIAQSKTGNLVEGQPEYQVVVSNTCRCAQQKIIIECFSMSSVEVPDNHVIKPIDDDKCMINDGGPIVEGVDVKFKYAWLTPQDFPLISSEIMC